MKQPALAGPVGREVPWEGVIELLGGEGSETSHLSYLSVFLGCLGFPRRIAIGGPFLASDGFPSQASVGAESESYLLVERCGRVREDEWANVDIPSA